MAVPLFARYMFFALGVLLVIIDGNSVVGTLIVPRPAGGRLMVWVDRVNTCLFGLVTAPIGDFRRRDRVLAAEAATLLVFQLVAWLAVALSGFTLMLWPFVPSFTDALDTAGPALWFIGDSSVHGWGERLVQYAAAFFGLVTVTLQIAYLPTLYSAFNRRETDIALLNARAGVPSWGPELLARTHYALGSGESTIDTLPDFYEQWERWAADIAESHTTYLPLVRFRSPRPLSSWVTALLRCSTRPRCIWRCPQAAPTVKARLCLRSGFQCFGDIARALGFAVPPEPDASQGISLTYDDFLKGIKHMRKVDFPIERDPAEAWPDFVGWRVNYEQAAYAVARDVDAVPALWSGPRKSQGRADGAVPAAAGPARRVPPGQRPAGPGPPARNHRSAEPGQLTSPAKEHPAKEQPAKGTRSKAQESQGSLTVPRTTDSHGPRGHGPSAPGRSTAGPPARGKPTRLSAARPAYWAACLQVVHPAIRLACRRRAVTWPSSARSAPSGTWSGRPHPGPTPRCCDGGWPGAASSSSRSSPG